MLNFSALLLKNYFETIGWNEDNLYSNLARSSSAILDFTVPPSLTLQLANSPTDIFFTSYALDALPQLNGSISYITSSQALPGIQPSEVVPLKTMVQHFRVYPPPRRPNPPDEMWLAGQLLPPPRDYLLYSRLHLPSLHLSGLATTKLSPTWQASVAFLHQPAMPPRPVAPTSGSGSTGSGPMSASGSGSAPPSTTAIPTPPPGNFMVTLQRDTGRYSTEYSYSVTDGMFGFKGLYNFGLSDAALRPIGESVDKSPVGLGETAEDVERRRIDEEEAMDSGLRGRFSAGGEVYFSRKQRSLGVSTGVRFTTVPPSPFSTNIHHSPPTTLTLLYNPLMGFLSTAYSAQITPHLVLSSRYGVNVYSYESDLTIGGEWWIGSGRGKGGWRGLAGHPLGEEAGVFGKTEPQEEATLSLEKVAMDQRPNHDPHDRDGVLKARVSGNGLISLLYESRIRKCLVSIGVVSDLSSRSSPIRAMGLEVQYFSE